MLRVCDDADVERAVEQRRRGVVEDAGELRARAKVAAVCEMLEDEG